MLHHIDHPLISAELTSLRDPDCPSHEFRQRVRRIASLMVFGVTADLERKVVTCKTPLESADGESIARPIILVPILRAGLGFLDGFLDLIPRASVAHIGLTRNEVTLQPEFYYFRHPNQLAEADLILLDPMLATGGSAIQAITTLLDRFSKVRSSKASECCIRSGGLRASRAVHVSSRRACRRVLRRAS